MIILDSNVLSAIIAPLPVKIVLDWLDRQIPSQLYLNAITIFEMRSGIELLAPGKKRQNLETAFEDAVQDVFGGRVLPFDRDAANEAGKLAARRRLRGRTGESSDTQIAGIAISRQAALATRNVKHFSDLNVPVIDPWTA